MSWQLGVSACFAIKIGPVPSVIRTCKRAASVGLSSWPRSSSLRVLFKLPCSFSHVAHARCRYLRRVWDLGLRVYHFAHARCRYLRAAVLQLNACWVAHVSWNFAGSKHECRSMRLPAALLPCAQCRRPAACSAPDPQFTSAARGRPCRLCSDLSSHGSDLSSHGMDTTAWIVFI